MFGSKVLNRRLRSKVLLTLKSGEVFEGVLWEADSEAFVLRNAVSHVHVATDPSATPVDGEVVVLTADVAYVQIP